MIDGTEKPKIPSKFAKRAARYNKFAYNIFQRLRYYRCHFFALKLPLQGSINNILNVFFFFVENAISLPGVVFSLRLYPCMSIGFPIPVTNILTSPLFLLAL